MQHVQEAPIATQLPASDKPAPITDVLKNRDFLKLWVAQILSQTAQQIINLALVLQVAGITGSSTAVSGIIISFTVPAILFAAIAGVFVERNSKKTMLVLTNVARGVMVLAYFFTDERWGVGAVLPIFYVVTFVFATVSQFFNPAEAAMIPLVVKRNELIAANSVFNLTLSATMLGGFVVLGPLLLGTVFHNNYNGLYLTIFVLCIAAAVLTYFLPQDDPGETAAARRQRGEKVGISAVAVGASQIARNGFRTAWDELMEGWNFIKRDNVIMSAILYWSIAIAVFMMIGTIGPQFLEQVLGIDKSQLFYVLMPGGVGLVIGVLLVGRISNPDNRETMINYSLLLAGSTLFLFAAFKPILDWIFSLFNRVPPDYVMLPLMGALTLLLGLFNSFISVPAQTALQERSPEKIRARVFSAFYTVSNAILVFPVVFAGTMADLLGHVPTVAIIGLVVLLIAVWGLRRSHTRKLRDVNDTTVMMTIDPHEAQAALAVAPGSRPIPAEVQQEEMADHASHKVREVAFTTTSPDKTREEETKDSVRG